MLQLHCGEAAAVEAGSTCWPISLVGPGLQRLGGVHVLVYPGNLEVLYHSEFLPASLRAALDTLCGLRRAAAASPGEDGESLPAPDDLDWDEVLPPATDSDSTLSDRSDTSGGSETCLPP